MLLEVFAVDSSYARMEALYALFRDVYTTSSQMSELFDEKFSGPAALVDTVARVSGRPGGLVLVAEEDRRPQGYLTLEPRRQARLRHTADLQMGVHSDARGRGIGATLIETALAHAARGEVVEIVYLMVRADNVPAIGLYARMGFDRVAALQRDTKIDGNYYDGVLMRRFVPRSPDDRVRLGLGAL
jgi:ribosomal protein S18 acetylase RimI-like enzyme